MGDPDKFSGSAALNYQICRNLNIEMDQFSDLDSLQADINRCDMIVDAIFGTGLDREVTGRYQDVINRLNKNDKPIVSLDIPSGINGDTGQVMGVAVRADATVTFGLPKTGNLLFPGYGYGGKLFVTHISFPPEISAADTLKIATNDPGILPAREGNAHKGSCGKVLFVAGSAKYMGAPYFAAMSFLKAGGGLSFLATTREAALHIGTAGNEIVLAPQQSTEQGSLAYSNKEGLLELAETSDMMVIGPGVSLEEETQKLVRELTAEVEIPVLVDGDGLTAIAPDLDILKSRPAPTVLTPHPGEMARLCNTSISQIESERLDLIRSKSREWNSIVVLKGAHTQIALPDGRVYINLSGNAGMATAGSGDVLTGIIAAMFGTGDEFTEAVRLGVFIHGFAGDLSADRLGEDGIIAGDIMNHIPYALKELRQHSERIYADNYRKIYLI
jgi:NAD(P)H-hydrate epimerase